MSNIEYYDIQYAAGWTIRHEVDFKIENQVNLLHILNSLAKLYVIS